MHFFSADKAPRHRRIKHRNGDINTKTESTSPIKPASVSTSSSRDKAKLKNEGNKTNNGIDDRTIIRRSKQDEHSNVNSEATQLRSYRAQSAKNRENSRYYLAFVYLIQRVFISQFLNKDSYEYWQHLFHFLE